MAAQIGHIGAEFRVGRVLGRAFGIWGRNIVPLALICLIANLPLYLPRMLVLSHVVVQKQLLSLIPITLTTLITAPLAYGIFVVLIFQALAGERLSIGPAIRRAFGRILPLIACSFCSVLAVVGGMILLFIPGLIVMTMLSVATQACVMERRGPIDSLGRSAALTKGHRWRVFGLLLIIGLVSLGAALLVNPLQLRVGIPGVITAFLLVGVANAFRDTVSSVLFNDLRVSKEGVGTERLASVFD